MKKLILALMLSIICIGANAQTTDDDVAKTNKWIETFKTLDDAKDWNGIILKSEECKQEIPNWEYVYFYCGIANYNLKQYENAISNLSIFLEKKPTEMGAYLIRGNSYSSIKNVEKAIADFNKYLEANPTETTKIQLYIANAYLNAKDLNGYANQLSVILQSDPNNISLLENRANAYINLNLWQKAVDDYNKLITLDSTDVNYYNNRAYSNYSLKTPESNKLAISDYNKVVVLGGAKENTFIVLASLNKEISDFKEEISAWDNLIKLFPDNMDYFYRRGTAKFNNKDYKGAIADYDVVIVKDPKHINALKRRVNAKNKINDVKGAQADSKLIRELEAATSPSPTKK